MQVKQMAPRRIGRPDAQTSEALSRHILGTATRLFIEQGYAATSIEQVALVAGSSKATIYRRYSSKEDLFAEVIKDITAVILETAVAAERAEKSASDPLATLREVSRAFLELAVRQEAIAVYRVLIAESPRFPEMVHRVMEAVGVPLEAVYLRLLNAARDAGQIRRDCPAEVQHRLLDGLITGWAVRESLLGRNVLTGKDERDAFFNSAWTIFLNGVTYI